MAIEKYRVRDVARDFGMPAKVITEILDKYATAPKSNMQALEDHELSIVFEHLTQNNQISNIAAIYADEPKKPEAPKVEAPKAEAPKAVEKLAEAKGKTSDMALYSAIEEIAPQLIAEKRRIYKGVSPNVDFYSGFVYDMLGIPLELYTPLFAIARVVGWSAHRIEELVGMGKIIRPAYKSVMEEIE